MKKVMKGITRILPAYGVFPLIFSFVFNCLVYSGSRMIAGGWYHHNIETGVDRSLPFVPQFLVIYFGCYLFWAVNYILIARQERRSVYQFFTGDFISRCICLGFFLAYPTTNTRPLITDGGLWNQAALWLYSIDAADNLFPSIHCLKFQKSDLHKYVPSAFQMPLTVYQTLFLYFFLFSVLPHSV